MIATFTGTIRQIREYLYNLLQSLEQKRASERLAQRVKDNENRAHRVRSMSITVKVVS
jgi:cation transport regulator ChaC